MKGKAGENVRAHLDDVSAAARRMGETIDSLLELARSMAVYATMSLAEGTIDPVIASRSLEAAAELAQRVGHRAVDAPVSGGVAGAAAMVVMAVLSSRLV